MGHLLKLVVISAFFVGVASPVLISSFNNSLGALICDDTNVSNKTYDYIEVGEQVATCTGGTISQTVDENTTGFTWVADGFTGTYEVWDSGTAICWRLTKIRDISRDCGDEGLCHIGTFVLHFTTPADACPDSDWREYWLYEDRDQMRVSFVDYEDESSVVNGVAADGAAKVVVKITKLQEGTTKDKITLQLAESDGSMKDDAKIANNVYTRTLKAPEFYVRADETSKDRSEGSRKIDLSITVNQQKLDIPEFIVKSI